MDMFDLLFFDLYTFESYMYLEPPHFPRPKIMVNNAIVLGCPFFSFIRDKEKVDHIFYLYIGNKSLFTISLITCFISYFLGHSLCLIDFVDT